MSEQLLDFSRELIAADNQNYKLSGYSVRDDKIDVYYLNVTLKEIDSGNLNTYDVDRFGFTEDGLHVVKNDDSGELSAFEATKIAFVATHYLHNLDNQEVWLKLKDKLAKNKPNLYRAITDAAHHITLMQSMLSTELKD